MNDPMAQARRGGRRGRFRRGTAAGFTLIETLIALVLLSLMLTILFSGLRLGAGSWDAAQRQVEESTEWAIAARFLQRQLGMAMPVQLFERMVGEQHLAFRGEPHRIRFVAPLPSYLGGGGVQWVSLFLGSTEQGDGLLLSHRLYHPDTFVDVDHQDAEATLLLPGVTGVTLRYYGHRRDDDAPDWFDTWEEEHLPWLVSLQLRRQNGHETTLAAGLRQGPVRTQPMFPGSIR